MGEVLKRFVAGRGASSRDLLRRRLCWPAARLGALLALASCGDGDDSDAGRDAPSHHDAAASDDARVAPTLDVGAEDAAAVDATRSDAPISADAGPDGPEPLDPVVSCTDQCTYVREGASGSGADWANALPEVPDPPVRGRVYFVASGTYRAREFNTPPDGVRTITIKRATVRNHGTDVGWLDEYGVGQARWGSPLHFMTSHWTFDGSTRNEADWFDGDAYGFRVDHTGEDQNILISNYGVDTSYVTIRHVFVDAIVGDLPDVTVRRYAIDTDGFDGGTIARGLRFERMFVHGSNNVWFLRTTEGAVVEYSASEAADSNDANHGEIVNLYFSGSGAVIRHNRIRDAFVGTTGTAIVAITDADGLEFYGNEVWRFSVGDGAIGFDGRASSHNRVYGNTFVGSTGFNAGMVWGSGIDNEVFNNLFVDCGTVRIEGAHDYNAFGDDSTRGEAHAQTGVTADIFVDAAGGDFALTRATEPGQALGAPYDVDRLGRTRGADGVVDRGALERR